MMTSMIFVVRLDGYCLVLMHRRTTDRIMRFATGSNHRHAKFASRIFACAKSQAERCLQIVNVSTSSYAFSLSQLTLPPRPLQTRFQKVTLLHKKLILRY